MTISDVADVAGVSKTAVSFAFNSPDRLGEATAVRIRDVADELGYRPDPVARMPQRRKVGSDRRAHAAGALGHLLEPVLRRLQRGRRPGGRGVWLRPPLHLARSTARSPDGRRPGDRRRRRRRSACRPTTPRSSRSAVPACRSCPSTRAPWPSTRSVEVDDEAGARAAAEHLLAPRPSRLPGHRRRAADGGCDGTTRTASWAVGCGAIGRPSRRPGLRSPDDRRPRRPGDHRRRHGRVPARPGRTGSGRRRSWR